MATPVSVPEAALPPGSLPSLVPSQSQTPEFAGAVQAPAAQILPGGTAQTLDRARSDAEQIHRRLETGDIPSSSAAGRTFDASKPNLPTEAVFSPAGAESSNPSGGLNKPGQGSPRAPAQPSDEDAYRPGPEELAFRQRMIALLGRYVARQGNGMANLVGYLGAGDYGTLASFIDSDFFGQGFIAGRAPWTRLFYRSYARSFLKNPGGHWTRLLGRLASAEATDYLTAISELLRRPANPVMAKALDWRDSIEERAAELVEATPAEELERLARRAEAAYLARSGDSQDLSTGSLDAFDQAVLVELYRFYRWMNARVEQGLFTDYYAQVIKGNTYRYTFDNGLLPFAQWGIFDHEPLPALSSARND